MHNLGSIEAKDSKGKGVEMDDEHAVTLEKLDEGWWAAEWLPAVKEGMNSNFKGGWSSLMQQHDAEFIPATSAMKGTISSDSFLYLSNIAQLKLAIKF